MEDIKYPIIHYPKITIKYRGSVYLYKDRTPNVYCFCETVNNSRLFFDTKKEAENHKREYSIKNGWVKNIIYEYQNYCEVELNDGLRCLFDKKDFEIIESYIWKYYTSAQKVHVFTSYKQTKILLKNMLLDYQSNINKYYLPK